MKLRYIVQSLILPYWNSIDEFQDTEFNAIIVHAVSKFMNFDFQEFMVGTCSPVMEEMIIFG